MRASERPRPEGPATEARRSSLGGFLFAPRLLHRRIDPGELAAVPGRIDRLDAEDRRRATGIRGTRSVLAFVTTRLVEEARGRAVLDAVARTGPTRTPGPSGTSGPSVPRRTTLVTWLGSRGGNAARTSANNVAMTVWPGGAGMVPPDILQEGLPAVRRIRRHEGPVGIDEADALRRGQLGRRQIEARRYCSGSREPLRSCPYAAGWSRR